MDHKEALASLETIRTILDRSTRYTHIAPAGIVAGGLASLAAALGGAAFDFGPADPGPFIVLWALAFLVAAVAGLGASARRARRQGEAFWSRKLQFVVAGFLAPSVGALLLTAALYRRDAFDICPGAWMVCYGIAILSVGVVLDWEFRATAWAFLVAGSASIFIFRDWPNLCLGVAFGGLHIVLGGLRLAMEGMDSCRDRAPSLGSRT